MNNYKSHTDDKQKTIFDLLLFRKWNNKTKPEKLIVKEIEYIPFIKNIWIRNFRKVK
jgi:hypothetical protein